jgi:hypothetical protein
MADRPAENEGFRILEDFICGAIPAPGIPTEGPYSIGENEGMNVQWELVVDASPRPLTEERKTELQKLTAAELLALVRQNRPGLTPAELAFIHEIALEKLTRQENPWSNGASDLARAVVQAFLRRIT